MPRSPRRSRQPRCASRGEQAAVAAAKPSPAVESRRGLNLATRSRRRAWLGRRSHPLGAGPAWRTALAEATRTVAQHCSKAGPGREEMGEAPEPAACPPAVRNQSSQCGHRPNAGSRRTLEPHAFVTRMHAFVTCMLLARERGSPREPIEGPTAQGNGASAKGGKWFAPSVRAVAQAPLLRWRRHGARIARLTAGALGSPAPGPLSGPAQSPWLGRNATRRVILAPPWARTSRGLRGGDLGGEGMPSGNGAAESARAAQLPLAARGGGCHCPAGPEFKLNGAGSLGRGGAGRGCPQAHSL